MATKIRLLAALGALVTAVIVVIQSGPQTVPDPNRGAALDRRTLTAGDQHDQVAGDRTPTPSRSTPARHPARRHPAHRPRFHPARARGRPALPLRRRELPDGGRVVRLAHLRGEPAPRRRRTGHRWTPRGPVLGDEADRLEQPVVDLLHGGVQDQLRRDPAVAVLLTDVLRPTTSTACRPTCSAPTSWRRTTGTPTRH